MTGNFLSVKKPVRIDDCKDLLAGTRKPDASIVKTVTEIVENIRKSGDRALLKYCARLDGNPVKTAALLAVPSEEIEKAAGSVPKERPDLVEALKNLYSNLKQYHERQLENDSREWSYKKGDGKLGQLIRPVGRVGIYVPGGRYIYPSSVLMAAVPAMIAGVRSITVCTPPAGNGKVDPVLLYLFSFLGISSVYRIGGAQAIAALAFGTETIRKVDKVVGPGNIYVTLAKKQVYGITGIDSLAGPSEILVLADDSAEPSFVAADLLSQAEHDPDARSILLTTSVAVADEVIKQIDIQLEEISRDYMDRFNKGLVIRALKNNCSIVFNPDIDFLIRLCNLIAPEHLEIMVSGHKNVLSRIKDAGAIFIGDYTPVAAGDYICGTNHIIPTGGNARFSSPLGVYDFIKKSSLVLYDKKMLSKESKYIETLADFENLLAHKNSIKVRIKK